jgi:hypothetical protein
MAFPSSAALERLATVGNAYFKHGGNYLLQGPAWSEKHWSGLVKPDWNLPKRITRELLCDGFQNPDSVVDAEALFVAAMIWGYGGVGYGPHRVGLMLKSASKREGSVDQFVHDLKEASQEQKYGAYEYLAKNVNRLDRLGPSFGSKLAYFSTPNHDSPILDSVVAAWIHEQEGRWLFNANKWSTSQYVSYQEYCKALIPVASSNAVGEMWSCGLVEHLMFVDQSLSGFPAWAKTYL